MKGRLKQATWILPLGIAALVALLGWWGNYRLRVTLEGELRTQLAATLNANVTALGIWSTNQTRLATALAEDPTVEGLANQIFQAHPLSRRDMQPEVQQFIGDLRPRLASLGYEVAELVDTNFAVIATSQRGQFGPATRWLSDAHSQTNLRNCSPRGSR